MRRFLAAVCSAALLALPARAAVVVSTFDGFSSQLFPPMGISWNSGGVDQYVQSSDSISITSVSGGDPKGDGYLIAGMPGRTLDHPEQAAIDFTGLGYFNLTARVDAGNASSIMHLTIYDDQFTAVGSAVFQATDFGSSFTLVSKAITFTGEGHTNLVTYFRIDGDGIASDAFRYSFSDLTASATPIPEPSLAFLSLAGLGAVGMRRLLRLRRGATAQSPS